MFGNLFGCCKRRRNPNREQVTGLPLTELPDDDLPSFESSEGSKQPSINSGEEVQLDVAPNYKQLFLRNVGDTPEEQSLSQWQRITRDFRCEHKAKWFQWTVLGSMAFLNVAKLGTAFLLANLIYYDFNPDMSQKATWNSDVILMSLAPFVFGCYAYYYLRNSHNKHNPLRHTNNLVETLEVGGLSYFYFQLMAELSQGLELEQDEKFACLFASIILMAIRNIDVDVSIYKNSPMGHILPAVFSGTSKSSYINSKLNPHSLPEPMWKQVLRYSLRAIHFLIQPIILFTAENRFLEFWQATTRTSENSRLLAAGTYAFTGLLGRCYDLWYAQGKPFRDIQNALGFRLALSQSMLSAFTLNTFQVTLYMAEWTAWVHQKVTDINTFKPFKNTSNTLIAMFCIFLPPIYFGICGAFDNKNMFQDFFRTQAKLRACLKHLVATQSNQDITHGDNVEQNFLNRAKTGSASSSNDFSQLLFKNNQYGAIIDSEKEVDKDNQLLDGNFENKEESKPQYGK